MIFWEVKFDQENGKADRGEECDRLSRLAENMAYREEKDEMR